MQNVVSLAKIREAQAAKDRQARMVQAANHIVQASQLVGSKAARNLLMAVQKRESRNS